MNNYEKVDTVIEYKRIKGDITEVHIPIYRIKKNSDLLRKLYVSNPVAYTKLLTIYEVLDIYDISLAKLKITNIFDYNFIYRLVKKINKNSKVLLSATKLIDVLDKISSSFGIDKEDILNIEENLLIMLKNKYGDIMEHSEFKDVILSYKSYLQDCLLTDEDWDMYLDREFIDLKEEYMFLNSVVMILKSFYYSDIMIVDNDVYLTLEKHLDILSDTIIDKYISIEILNDVPNARNTLGEDVSTDTITYCYNVVKNLSEKVLHG